VAEEGKAEKERIQDDSHFLFLQNQKPLAVMLNSFQHPGTIGIVVRCIVVGNPEMNSG
jgi:hypothetical protein